MTNPPLRPPPEFSSLYVVQFSQGTIKIGQTTTVVERLRAHLAQASQFGISVTKEWASDPHLSAFRLEKDLIVWCAERASRIHGKEWFDGLAFAEVKATAIDLLEGSGS